MKLFKALGASGASLLLTVIFAPAHATSTDVVLNLEGNPTCSSLGDNSAVLEFRDSNPESSLGSPKFVTLNIVDADGEPAGNQIVEYTVSTDNIPKLSWAITSVNGFTDQETEFFQQVNPINYVILKAQGGANGARVFHFGAAGPGSGAIADDEEEATGTKLAAVSFCYGLTTTFGPVEEPEPMPVVACEDLTVETLDGTGITCEAGGEQRLLINMELNATNFGFDDAFHACTCNVSDDGGVTFTGLPECNPALPAFDVSQGSQDGLPAEQRSCMEYDPDDPGSITSVPAGVNAQVPFVIQGVENPDSYICYTIDGVRRCYGHY